MRAVNDPFWVKRDLPDPDILPAHKFPIHIIDHFIRIHIAVIVRNRDGFRVVVKQPGHKVTNYKGGGFKYLVNGWWLMNPPRDRLKVVDRESKWVMVPVPADHVER